MLLRGDALTDSVCEAFGVGWLVMGMSSHLICWGMMIVTVYR